MTLRSRRKHPITRPNLRPGKATVAKLALFAAALAAGNACIALAMADDGWSARKSTTRDAGAKIRQVEYTGDLDGAESLSRGPAGLVWRPTRPSARRASRISTQSSYRPVQRVSATETRSSYDPFEPQQIASRRRSVLKAQPRAEFDPFEQSAPSQSRSQSQSSSSPPLQFHSVRQPPPSDPPMRSGELPPPNASAETQTAPDDNGASEPGRLPSKIDEGVEQEQVTCESEREKLRNKLIAGIGLDILPTGTPGTHYPIDCTSANEPFMPRHWAETTYLWKASALCHKPLYFEQEQLERYGHSWGPILQPVASAAHFFVTMPILPYKMGLRTPDECVYALGHYRPGSCAPYMLNPLGFTWRAALFEAGAVVGTAAALP